MHAVIFEIPKQYFIIKPSAWVDLASLKFNVDKLVFDKLRNAPSNLNNLESKVDKLDVNKSVSVPVDLSK